MAFITHLNAQNALLKGSLADTSGNALLGASVILIESGKGTVTDKTGTYELEIPAEKNVIVQFSYLGYKIQVDTVYAKPNQVLIKNITLLSEPKTLSDVVITSVQQRENSLTRISMKSIDQLPNTSGNIETILKTFSGVVSGNELSSQYSVRGGSYDENLVYVNDIEIHRPLLVQSAQQEGLSFVNPNMVSSIQFSAGGFESRYGDKMASVLDITYKKPTEFEGTVIASLLGSNIHLAGTSKSKKLTYNVGGRYKTTQYLLSSLDVEGEYMPRFADIQSYLTYDLGKKSSVSVLGNYTSNRFSMVPETRSTDFGTVQKTLNFMVYYEGQEKDRFDSYLGAITYAYTPADNLSLKLIASAFRTDEEVSYDILSEYLINQISRGTSSSDSDTIINIGIGGGLEHARNALAGTIRSIEHKGVWAGSNSTLKWGLKFQYEKIKDVLKEWRITDSAGMVTPYTNEYIAYDYNVSAKNTLNSYRYQAYIQNNSRFFANNAEYGLTYGLRANYWDYNEDLLISPRLTFTFKPYWERKVDFYFASGLYGQPPFYKEIKDYKGQIFPDRKAQKSIHFVLGTDVHYTWWNRPFLLSTEIYYKYLYDLVPYKIENIELEYMPEYEARGYAKGVDFRINGEFVPGVESWFSLSFLKSMEDTYNDYYKKLNGEVIYPGYYRRPMDQRVTISVFFQDYLPSNPDYKLHLLVNYGTGLPYSGPDKNIPSQVYSLNQYRRVDVGFSRIIRRKKNKMVGLNDIWISAEVLNMIGAINMASYDWIRTVENNSGVQDFYSVPNYLTGRRFNLKISTKL